MPRPVLLLLGAAGAVLVIAGLHRMAHLVAPVVFAMILTIAAHPLRPRLMRQGMPGWLAARVVMLVAYLTLAALLVSLLFSAAQFVRLIPTYEAQWDEALDTAAAWLRDVGVDAGAPTDTRDGLELGRLVEALDGLLGGLGGVTSALALVVTFVFFMTLDAGWFSKRLLRLSGRRHWARHSTCSPQEPGATSWSPPSSDSS